MTTLALHLSGLRLVIETGPCRPAFESLRAVWHATTAVRYVREEHEKTYSVGSREGGFTLDGFSTDQHVVPAEAVAPLIEGALYYDFIDRQCEQRLSVLHAAGGVTQRGDTLVFLGASGAGKSALARACVDAGLAYLGDEHLITDGRALWGLPRAIQLDPWPEDCPRLPWHDGADTTSYRFVARSGRAFRLPLVRVPAERVQPAPVPVASTVLVALQRGQHDAVKALAVPDRLTLLESSHFVRNRGLNALALAKRAYQLTWRDPHKALSLLLHMLENEAGA